MRWGECPTTSHCPSLDRVTSLSLRVISELWLSVCGSSATLLFSPLHRRMPSDHGKSKTALAIRSISLRQSTCADISLFIQISTQVRSYPRYYIIISCRKKFLISIFLLIKKLFNTYGVVDQKINFKTHTIFEYNY